MSNQSNRLNGQFKEYGKNKQFILNAHGSHSRKNY